MDILGFLIGVGLSTLCMFIASKLIGFQIFITQLFIISAVTVGLGYIPQYGWMLALVSLFILLKYMTTNQNVILMVIVSFVTSMGLLTGLKSVVLPQI